MSGSGTVGWIKQSALDNGAPGRPYCSDLQAGERLYVNANLWSSDGRYRVVMQGDGNLVLYGPGGPTWASNTSGAADPFTVLQGDGNLVVYSNTGPARWNAGTAGFGGATVVMQSDGNLVEYAPGGYGAVWASSWHQAPGGARRSNYNWAQGDTSQCTFYALEQWANSNTNPNRYPNFKYGANAGGWVGAIDGWPAYQQPMSQALVVWPGDPGHVGWVLGVRPRGPQANAGYDMLLTDRNYDWKGTTRQPFWTAVPAGVWFIPAPAL